MGSNTTTPVVFLAGSLVAAIFGVVGMFVDFELPPGVEAELTVVVGTLLAWFLPTNLKDSIPSRGPKL